VGHLRAREDTFPNPCAQGCAVSSLTDFIPLRLSKSDGQDDGAGIKGFMSWHTRGSDSFMDFGLGMFGPPALAQLSPMLSTCSYIIVPFSFLITL
jgi:hypothetical protein